MADRQDHRSRRSTGGPRSTSAKVRLVRTRSTVRERSTERRRLRDSCVGPRHGLGHRRKDRVVALGLSLGGVDKARVGLVPVRIRRPTFALGRNGFEVGVLEGVAVARVDYRLGLLMSEPGNVEQAVSALGQVVGEVGGRHTRKAGSSRRASCRASATPHRRQSPEPADEHGRDHP